MCKHIDKPVYPFCAIKLLGLSTWYSGPNVALLPNGSSDIAFHHEYKTM